MADSVIPLDEEMRLRFGCALVNRCARLLILTDALVAAASSFQDLLDDLGSALLLSSNDKYPPEVTTYIRYLLAELTFLHSIGQLSDTDVTSLLTARGTAASTDLRYRFYNLITDSSFDYTDESFVDGAFGASAYTANLT